MKNARTRKKLTYIVNHVRADDAQHYVHIPALLTQLEKLGWEVDLISERGGSGQANILGQQVTFLSRRSKGKRLFNLIGCLLKMRFSGGQLVFVRISKFAAVVSAALGRLFGWRTVYWLSGAVEDFNLRTGMRGRVGFGGIWILLRLVDRLATGPESMVKYYRRVYRLSKSKIVLLYNDVAVETVCNHEPPSQSGTRVLLVHRLSPVRETDRYFPQLLNVLGRFGREQNEPVSLDICGDGPERPILERIAESASDVKITFHGAVPQRRLGEFYRNATIFVVPSYREGFPRVVIEAMAHGLPIVATDAGGTRDLCGTAQQAYVTDRNDPLAFGRAIERLLASSEERRRLAQENLETVKRFSTREVARMYDLALSSLIGASSGR